VRGRPWGGEAQESHAPRVGPNSRLEVADSRAEQGPEGEGRRERRPWTPEQPAGCFRAERRGSWSWERFGRCNDVKRERRRGRRTAAREGKALKGEPQERIWHETRPAGPQRMEASRGRENLEAQADEAWKPRPTRPLLRAGRRCRGRDPMGGSRCRRARRAGREPHRRKTAGSAGCAACAEATAAREPAYSEEARKLERGALERPRSLRRPGPCEDPGAQRKRQGQEGSLGTDDEASTDRTETLRSSAIS
jgi:hypothetical protein